MRMSSDQVLLPSTSVPQTWSERLLVFKETRRGKLQNFHMEVAESGSADCGCDLARRGGLQETRWPTFGMSEMPSDAQHCAALHRGLSSTVYSGSLCVEPSRAEPRRRSHTAGPVSSLNTHRCTVTHKGQAIKKIARVSPSLAGSCYHGDAVTNWERVRASAPTSMSEGTWRSSISHDGCRVFSPLPNCSSWVPLHYSRARRCLSFGSARREKKNQSKATHECKLVFFDVYVL